MLNVLLLKSKMILNGDNNTTLSKFLGISRQTLANKMNGNNGSEFYQSEISSIKKRYNLTASEIDDIFFNQKVS